jgi:2',3'-cyclic-nucleotide 2'-phosphodiesterase (5'-nucleotidase family)
MRRVLLVLLLLLTLAFPALAADTFQLTLLHTNDMHGQMRPFDYDDWNKHFGGPQKSIGGLARRATLIRRLARETKHPLLVIDTGDTFTRGPWAEQWFGVPEIEAMNAMGYDLLCVGNNEFQATGGPDAQGKMLLLMRRSRFPWLAANLTTESGDPVEGIHPFVVREFDGVRVGFLGLIPSRVAEYDWIKGWKTVPPIEAAKRWVPVARKECDVLILTAHLGEEEAAQVVAAVPGIDALIGGDSHSFIAPPLMLKGPDGAQVPMVMAGERGTVLGRFDLTFEHDTTWRLVKSEEHLLPITASLREDRAVLRLLSRYLDAPKRVAAPVLAPAH